MAELNSDKPKKIPGVREYDLEDEVMLYAPGESAVMTLNKSARQIWELCDGSRSEEEICAELGARYQVAPEAFQNDVRSTLGDLGAKGLVLLPV